MPSYETLDLIADAYIPLLAILSLSLIVISLFKSRWQVAGLQILALVFVLLIAYGLMFLDNRFQIWPAFGLDYSTHTAVSLSLVVFLSFNKPNRIIIWVGSFIAYLLLMLYQRYHTFSDIAVTGVRSFLFPYGLFLRSFIAVDHLSPKLTFLQPGQADTNCGFYQQPG
jgi:hypothetical protein